MTDNNKAHHGARSRSKSPNHKSRNESRCRSRSRSRSRSKRRDSNEHINKKPNKHTKKGRAEIRRNRAINSKLKEFQRQCAEKSIDELVIRVDDDDTWYFHWMALKSAKDWVIKQTQLRIQNPQPGCCRLDTVLAKSGWCNLGDVVFTDRYLHRIVWTDMTARALTTYVGSADDEKVIHLSHEGVEKVVDDYQVPLLVLPFSDMYISTHNIKKWYENNGLMKHWESDIKTLGI